MIDIARNEFVRFPRGTRGSLQNLFRMIWWNVRMNSLGRRPEAGRSLAEVDAYALKLMRDFYPDFGPTLA